MTPAREPVGSSAAVEAETARLLPFPQASEAIELRHLRAFVAVAEDLNFGRAAARLYVSQPALSRQIRSLERLVGCELLRRSTHRVELTVAGESLLDRARRVLADVDAAISATQAVGDELVSRGNRLWQPVVDAAAGGLEGLRAAYEDLHAQFDVPPDVRIRPVNAGGVPSLLAEPSGAGAPTLLYLHGGGYIMGSAFGYRPLAGAVAVASGASALIADYRLSPEHAFPAALEDALAAYTWMCERGADAGDVTIVGDSIGGGLALALLLKLKELGEPMPGGAVLFCPGVDLTFESDDRSLGPDQPKVAAEMMQFMLDAYLAGHPADDPLVSPLLADLSGLPPLLIQAATGDDRLEDAKRLATRAREHGVDARLELYPVATHVFQVFWSFLPEASEALQQAGAFARRSASG
jgi:epsilon-lactone hydrolase